MTDQHKDKRYSVTKNIKQVVLFWLLIISFSSCALLTLYTVQVQYRNFKREAQFIREQYLKEQKKILQQKVNEAVIYAKYNSKKINDRLKDDIESRVHEAFDLATHLYNEYGNKFTTEETARIIKESLRPLRFNQGRGYYFIVSLDGVEELYPTRPELEGQNLIDLQDITGKFVIRNEIATVKKYGEGFVTGYWPNPLIENDPGSRQYSFVKLFKPLNWLIGTGEFLTNVEEEVQAETLEWLSKIRFAQRSYIFAETYQGDALLMDGKVVREDTNIWDLEDPDGVLVIQEEIRIAKSNEGGGFLRYSWQEENNKTAVPVISFVKAVPEWGWVLGSSIYIDDIESSVALQESTLRQNVINDIQKILLGFCISIPFFTLLSILISKKFTNELNVFLSFFKQMNESESEIDLADLKLREFFELGKATNRMIARRREAEEKLELLSRTDPLTGLSNRRDMVEKIHLEVKRATRSGTVFSFLLIDIDHFKQVNDTFGHEAGDTILQKVSDLLRGAARQTDSISRWGGEEFLVLLPNADAQGAVATAEKFRQLVLNTIFSVQGQNIQITLTLGVSMWRIGRTYEQVIGMADAALYQGKASGRNRVVRAEDPE